MDFEANVEDPWVRGWLAGKYAQPVVLPVLGEFEEWMGGFETGCAEVAEHHIWERRLGEYILGRMAGIYAGVADFVL